MFNEDLEDRKDVRREHINSKKAHTRSKDVEKKAQKKLNRQYRNRKVDLEQEELWENWQEEYK
jgi:hypothetical protein